MILTTRQEPDSADTTPTEPVDFVHATNFSKRKKRLVVVIGIITGINTNLGMSLPSGAAKVIAKHFSVTDPLLLVLLTSIYLLGFALGPLVFGPLSERLGRRPVLVSAYLLYALWTACCGLSPSYGALLAFRFLAGAAAAAPMAVAGALYADVYNDPERRGRAIAYFMCIGMSSPNLGPAISGYAGHVSWNLPFWIGAALAGVFVPLVLLLPETYAPALERHARAKAVVAGGDGGQQVQGSVSRSIFGGMGKDVRVVFSQPFVMMGREPVVMFTSLYCAFVYALPFLFFQAYPIIYKNIYGLSPGQVGLTFLPFIVGAASGLAISLWYSSYHARAFASGAPWALKVEHRRLPLACAGSPALIIALFWLGWTAHPSIHPAVPASSGLLFGGGTAMIFVAMINYLSDAYRQHAAPAQAAASTARSLVAVGLPLAAPPLYQGLGVRWACSLLGVVMLGLTAVPFAFIRHGAVLRSRSPFCQKVMMLEEGPGPATVEQHHELGQRPPGKEMSASERESRMIA